jgi:hypothetical protein
MKSMYTMARMQIIALVKYNGHLHTTTTTTTKLLGRLEMKPHEKKSRNKTMTKKKERNK